MSQIPVTAEDLYLYAMRLLSEEDHARLQAFLEQSPEARAELNNVYGDLALLALSTEQHQPPESARQRLMNEVAREPRAASPAAVREPAAATVIVSEADRAATVTTPAAPVSVAPVNVAQVDALPGDRFTLHQGGAANRAAYDDEPAPRRSFMAAVVPWAGWAVAAGLAVSTYTLYQGNQRMQEIVTSSLSSATAAKTTSARAQAVLETLRSPAAQRFVLTKQNAQPAPSARVTYVADSGAMVFQGNNLEPLPDDKTYELWLIPKGEGRTPIPAGTFRPDQHGFASVILPPLPHGIVAATFGVTMEEEQGSQTPTLPILMIGS